MSPAPPTGASKFSFASQERSAPPNVLNSAGGVIAVEYPMNYLRPIIISWKHSFRGKTFPRQVTAPNGSPRWQSRSGKSFASLEEASRG